MAKLILPIDSADEHAKALGRFISHWALVESHLISILGLLLKINQSRARIVYLETSSLGAKFRLMRRLAYSYVDESTQRKKLLRLIGDAQKLSDIRNKYAHATWGAGRDGALSLLHGTPPSDAKMRVKPSESVTSAKILEDVEKVDALVLRLQTFGFEVAPTMAIHERPHK